MPSAFDDFLATCAGRFDALDTAMPRKARGATTAPAPLLGHVAWSRGLDYWDSAWPEATKRQLAQTAPANARVRGTRAAIDRALSAFASDLVIEEWWESTPEGAPGTATATVLLGTALGNDSESQETILRLLEREGRKSVHWDLVVGAAGVDALAPMAVARVTVLTQLSGVQSGA